MGSLRTTLTLLVTALVVAGACSRGEDVLGEVPLPDAGTDVVIPPPDGSTIDAPCGAVCSSNRRQVLSACSNAVIQSCGAGETCDDGACVNACELAELEQASVGCDYYAVNTDILLSQAGSCFVAFVTNTFASPAHLELEFAGAPIDVATYARIPVGQGGAVTYAPYDPVAGLPPGEVAILFLANAGGVECPVKAAKTTGAWVAGTGWGNAFHIKSDVPVVAFQMLPYGGGSAAITGASLLLPTSAWGTNYIAVNAWSATAAPPSLNIVAAEDGTEVTILPRVAIEGRSGIVDSSPANIPITYKLEAGEFLQLSQDQELTGSPLAANKKIALFGGSQCMYVPTSTDFYCDHAEQQIPPVQALGSEYVAAPYRARTSGESKFLYRLVGAVDGTTLSYDPPVSGAPATLELGQTVELWSETPFVVKSQDDKHPFMLFSYMTGGDSVAGYGDPDFVRVVATEQYLDAYVFFTDPTYPETNLVVIRARDPETKTFHPVSLDCAGELDGWQSIDLAGNYELTRVDLVRHDFEPQGQCDNGAHEMHSSGPFGVTVWSWGGPETTGGSCPEQNPPPTGTFTCHVSYGYAAGESLRPVNEVVIPPVPR